MTNDVLERLRATGLDFDKLTEEQKQVLAELSQEEADILFKIRDRMHAAGPDVQGYAEDVTGVFYY